METPQGKLHLVDLAGSECAKKGGLIYAEATVLFNNNNQGWTIGGMEEIDGNLGEILMETHIFHIFHEMLWHVNGIGISDMGWG